MHRHISGDALQAILTEHPEPHDPVSARARRIHLDEARRREARRVDRGRVDEIESLIRRRVLEDLFGAERSRREQHRPADPEGEAHRLGKPLSVHRGEGIGDGYRVARVSGEGRARNQPNGDRIAPFEPPWNRRLDPQHRCRIDRPVERSGYGPVEGHGDHRDRSRIADRRRADDPEWCSGGAGRQRSGDGGEQGEAEGRHKLWM